MSSVDPQALRDLLDREAIRECLYRYCRGIDRLDEAALRSAYWPDGTDHHGAYQGSASGFIEMALVKLRNAGRMVHQISNILIELRGSVAAVESSFLAFQQDLDAQGQPVQTLLLGRYVDRFEQREGQWRVAARTVVYDWMRQQAMSDQDDPRFFGVRQPQGARKSVDPLYDMLAQL